MSLFGGLLGGAGSIIGAGINAGIQNKINKENAELQKEFAQNGIQWKVEDAKKAGIHPLAALGAQTYSATPSYVGSNVGSGVSDMLKSFGQAFDKKEVADELRSQYLDKKAKDDVEFQLNTKLKEAELKRMELENARLNNSLKGFGSGLSDLSIFGDTDNRNAIKTFGQNLNASKNKVPAKKDTYGIDTKNVFNDVGFVKYRDGTFGITYPKDRQDLYSESIMDKLSWSLRNLKVSDDQVKADVKMLEKRLGSRKRGYKVVPLPWRPGQSRRFKEVPINDNYNYGSPWNQIKALFYENKE